jgi:hypothetical protein
MSSAIVMCNVKNVMLRNVWISRFKKGVEAVNSNLLLIVYIRRCNIGLNLINNNATIYNTIRTPQGNLAYDSNTFILR